MNACIWHITIAICGLLLLPLSGGAQTLQGAYSTDRQDIQIGEQVQVQVSVLHDAPAEFQFPDWKDQLKGFDLISVDSVRTASQEGRLVTSQMLVVTSFDSGTQVLPPLAIPMLAGGANSVDTIAVEEYPIEVTTVELGEQAEIKDVKEIREVPLPTWVIFAGIGILIALGLIGWGIYYLVTRPKPEAAPEPVEAKPAVPAHEIAMRKLAQLESKKLWQAGEVKEYYAEISEILRDYLERKFSIPALESVTHEIMDQARELPLTDKMRRHLKDTLEMADLAKFAKFTPSEQAHLDSMDIARYLVKETKKIDLSKPEPEETTEPETEPAA
ncbi:hypothetical protein [Pontibacter sp. G13]|uniref:hypothetical protein n=1 Tax=Pontibacter sp. G13 TaxID=3074898 RepID=UPI00288A2AA1|nr:hypothetical protein [Pontibacter sp. G13]WNJ19908.1 hypothetical protein RJD25_05445 [Pontibacter sp. G13]